MNTSEMIQPDECTSRSARLPNGQAIIGNMEIRNCLRISRQPVGHARPFDESVIERGLVWIADDRGRGILIGIDLRPPRPCVFYSAITRDAGTKGPAELSLTTRLSRLESTKCVTRVALVDVYGVPDYPDLSDPTVVDRVVDAALVFAFNQPDVRNALALLADEKEDVKNGGKPGSSNPKPDKPKEGKGESEKSEESGVKVKGKIDVEIEKKEIEPTTPNKNFVKVTATGEVEIHKAAVFSDLFGLVNCTKVKKSKSIKVKGTLVVIVKVITEVVDEKTKEKKKSETDVTITIDADVEVDVFEESKKILEGILGKKLEYEPDVKP